MLRLLVFRLEELRTDENVEVKGEAVDVGRPVGSSDDEPRSVAKGARPRRAPVAGAGRPQAEGCALAARLLEFLFVTEAMEF